MNPYRGFADNRDGLEGRAYVEAPPLPPERSDLERLRDAALALARHGVRLVKLDEAQKQNMRREA